MLSAAEVAFYSRQLILPDIGVAGQRKLKNSSALIFGCGGLGAPAALYLAASGVGSLGLLDRDLLELSNLQRQIIYRHGSIGGLKSELAAEEVQRLNPFIKVFPHQLQPSEKELSALIARYDCVLDCADNQSAKLLLNKLCFQQGKLLFHAAVRSWAGQAATFVPGQTSCLACLFNSDDSDSDLNECATTGVLGPLCGILGLIQAMEVIKFILGLPLLAGQLLLVDAKSLGFEKISLKKNPDCVICHPR